MKRRIELDLHAHGITHIREALLHKYVGLRTLDLSCNHITKIEGLELSPELSELKLYSNTIKTIDGLERLGQLSILLLHDNQIRAIGPGLSAQRKLQVLRLDHNKLEGISWGEIGSCSHLLQLDLSNNSLKLVTGRCDLEQLEELRLANNQITALPDLAGCKMLYELELSGNPLCVNSLSALAVLKNLKILCINAVGLDHFEQLPALRGLEELYVSGNSCKSVQGLPDLFLHLEVLDVRTNCIAAMEQLTPLCKMAYLNELLLEGNPVCLSCSRNELTSLLPQIGSLSFDRPTAISSGVPSCVEEDDHAREVSLLLTQAELDLKQCQDDIVARFELLRGSAESELGGSHHDLVFSTPQYDVADTEENHAESVRDKPPSRCGSHARLKEALVFAGTCNSSN
ncbi:hypothetical protein EMCRGX_G028454 [Ephydatia muelleri]|eukprot:Em0020g193a